MSTPVTSPPAAQAPTPGPAGTTVATTPGTRPATNTYGTSTPALLRGIRSVVISVLLLFAGLTIVGTIAPDVALGSARDEVGYGMELRNTRATLAEADRRASVAFLDPAAAAAAGEWTAYESTLDSVSQMLVLSASQHPVDATALALVQLQINDYRRAVETAHTTATTDAAAGGTRYAATSSKLVSPMDTLSALAQASDSRVGSGLAWAVGTWAVIAAWVALGVLLVSSVLIARRTRRVLNLGLVIGIVLVGLALTMVSTANGMVRQSLADVRTTSLAAARIHADTRTLAEQAKAAEARTLLVAGSGTADWNQSSATLAATLGSLPDPTAKATQTTQWQVFLTAHGALPTSSSEAKAQARSTTLKPLTAFVETAARFSAIDQATALQALTDARKGQLPIGIFASSLGLLAIIAALWGITRRLAEYV